MRLALGAVIEVAGLALIGCGLWLLYEPVAIIWAGLVTAIVGIAIGGRR